MSRDDYISKLFIKNQDKLDEAPSDDFWSKLETQLDETMPVVEKGQPQVIRLTRYFAAASVVFVALGALYLLQYTEMDSNETLAIQEIEWVEPMALLTDTEGQPLADAVVMPTRSLAAAEKEEDDRQEEKIVAAVKKQVNNQSPITTNTIATIEIDDINIVDKAYQEEGSSLIFIEPEPEENLAIEPQNTLQFNQDVPQIQQSMNYANLYGQTSNEVVNKKIAEEVLSKAKEEQVVKRSPGKRGGGIVKNSKKIKRAKSPMASAHARLQPFGFLLGRWVDDNEMEGKSHEHWSLKNATTLVGKGYKLNDGARIFEEMMRIEFRDNQVFLIISLDDKNETIDYMMTSFDNERYIFKQSMSKNYPDKVVIQRNLDGYSTIILNNKQFLSAEQQRYLENRNRVSNVRSIRTMRYEE
jgi:hypothetical protein